MKQIQRPYSWSWWDPLRPACKVFENRESHRCYKHQQVVVTFTNIFCVFISNWNGLKNCYRKPRRLRAYNVYEFIWNGFTTACTCLPDTGIFLTCSDTVRIASLVLESRASDLITSAEQVKKGVRTKILNKHKRRFIFISTSKNPIISSSFSPF